MELTDISALSLDHDGPLSSRVAMGSENLSQTVILLYRPRIQSQQGPSAKYATENCNVENSDDLDSQNSLLLLYCFMLSLAAGAVSKICNR